MLDDASLVSEPAATDPSTLSAEVTGHRVRVTDTLPSIDTISSTVRLLHRPGRAR